MCYFVEWQCSAQPSHGFTPAHMRVLFLSRAKSSGFFFDPLRLFFQFAFFKLTKAELTPIAEKHKLLANTLINTKKPLSSDNWEIWKVDFKILMRNVRLDTIILKELDEEAQKDTLFVHFNQLARDNNLYNVGRAMRMFLMYGESARERERATRN